MDHRPYTKYKVYGMDNHNNNNCAIYRFCFYLHHSSELHESSTLPSLDLTATYIF